MAQYQVVHFNLNGRDVEKIVDVRASLTDMLRNDYHMTSVKKGCEVGECGACNVIIDGECFNSCIYLAVWAEGKHIRTLESLLGDDSVNYLTETITMQMGNRMEKNPDVRYYPIEDNAPLSDYVTIDETTEFEIDEEGNPVILFPAGTVTDEAHGEQSFRIPKLYS